MGSLFSLGGLLKLEAKSYLHSLEEERISEKKSESVLVAALWNGDNEIDQIEQARVRILCKEDMEFFKVDFS
jgi:hypothetical protein